MTLAKRSSISKSDGSHRYTLLAFCSLYFILIFQIYATMQGTRKIPQLFFPVAGGKVATSHSRHEALQYSRRKIQLHHEIGLELVICQKMLPSA